jgi:hypothetical protein
MALSKNKPFPWPERDRQQPQPLDVAPPKIEPVVEPPVDPAPEPPGEPYEANNLPKHGHYWEDRVYTHRGVFRMVPKQVTIKLEDGTLVKGKINLAAEKEDNANHYRDQANEGFYSRVSDLFTKGKSPFVTIFDATLDGKAGRVLVVNKNKVLYIIPED